MVSLECNCGKMLASAEGLTVLRISRMAYFLERREINDGPGSLIL